jgi:hypothetical protein
MGHIANVRSSPAPQAPWAPIAIVNHPGSTAAVIWDNWNISRLHVSLESGSTGDNNPCTTRPESSSCRFFVPALLPERSAGPLERIYGAFAQDRVSDPRSAIALGLVASPKKRSSTSRSHTNEVCKPTANWQFAWRHTKGKSLSHRASVP